MEAPGLGAAGVAEIGRVDSEFEEPTGTESPKSFLFTTEHLKFIISDAKQKEERHEKH